MSLYPVTGCKRSDRIGGILIIKLSTEEKRVLSVGPDGVVLDLSDLHRAALGKGSVDAEAKIVVAAVKDYLCRAVGDRIDDASRIRAPLEVDLALLEAVAQLVNPVCREGMRPVGADGIAKSRGRRRSLQRRCWCPLSPSPTRFW